MPVTPPPSIPFFPAFTTAVGTFIQAGCRIVSYVRSTGAQSGDDITIGNNLDLTLAAGLAKCSRAGDTVLVLPGHAENVTTTPTFPAGCRVVGVPAGTSTPTFTWTATSSQWAISNANVLITGLKLVVAGAVVVKGIYVTGAYCSIVGNEIVQATGASNKATILLETDTGADNFLLADNWIYGTATHNSTNGILITAATSQTRIVRNVMEFSVTAANGNIHFVGASLNNYVADNDLANTHTSSSACILADATASTGLICRNNLSTLVGTGTAPAAAGIVLTANCLMRAFENFSCPTAALSGDIAPARDT